MAKNTTNLSIDTKGDLPSFPVRTEPYWRKIKTGWHIGYRQGESGGSWVARFTDEQRKRHYLALGSVDDISFDEASELASKFCGKYAAGVDSKYTVRQALEDYLANRKVEKGEKSATHARQVLYKHLPDNILDTAVVNLKKPNLRSWRNKLTVAKSTQNRIIADLQAALNLAYGDDVVDNSRAWSKLKHKNADKARDVFLTPEQEQSLLDNCSGQFKVLVEAALITGARPPGELAALRVEDFDADEGTLTIRGEETGAGKTGRRVVYLSDRGIAFFNKQTKNKTGKAYIIPKDNGQPWKSSNHQFPWVRARAATLNEKELERRIPIEATMYCLRHTAISRMLKNGVQVQVVAENVGTSIIMIQKHYGKFLPTDRRAMLNAAEATG